MKSGNKNYGFDTLSIHAGGCGKNANNALNPPIYQTSTFIFDDIEHVERIMSFECDDCVYTRGNNPTLKLLEEKMAALENGKGAIAFASGMAAISSTLFSLLRPGDNLITNRTIYGSSYNVVSKVLPKYNISYKVADMENLDSMVELIDENTKVIYFETPSNPNLSIVDIKKVVAIAKEHNLKVVIDNTFATPYFQRPLELGVDVVVHSATKYICGHGDVIAGIAVARDEEYLHKLRFDYLCEFGGVMSPFNAWLLLRGLKTLGVRMRAHESNAIALADYLEKHEKVVKVMYPGLKSFKNHQIACEQMSGFGAMISFEVVGGMEEAKKLVNNVSLAKLAVSLGDCETLIEVPSLMTHRGYPKERLEEFGFKENMVRISVGLENIEDIIADIDFALSCI